MARPGKFYDQDDQADRSASDNPWGPPARAGRGMLYDQDASVEMPRVDPLIEAQLRREEHQKREEQRRREGLRHRREEQQRQEEERRREEQRALQRRDRPAPDESAARTAERAAGPDVSGRPGAVRISSRAAPVAGVGRPAPGVLPPDWFDTSLPESEELAEPLQPAPGPTRRGRPAPPASRRSPGRPEVPSGTAQRDGAAVPSTGRATAVLAFGTFASRLTGFARVLVLGYVLGVGALSDAFNYANGVPNIVYDLLLGGILSATLIPVFVEQLGAGAAAGPPPGQPPMAGAQPDEGQPRSAARSARRAGAAEASHSISAVLTAISLALLVVSAVLWLAAPLVIHFYLLLNQASTGGAERALATRLLRWFAPQVFFLGTIVATTALLNARRRFTAAAVSPVVNNLIAIAALLATKAVAASALSAGTRDPNGNIDAFTRDSRAVLVLGLGTTLGYAVQLVVQVPALHRLGLRLRPVLDLRHPAVRRVAGLSSWLVGVVLANQLSLALVMVLAARRNGWLTAYQYSYQFFQLPYALIAVSVASAIMPDLSERWAARQRVLFQRQFVTGLRTTLAVLVPVALLYMAVAQPLIQLAIHHGRVSQSGAHLIGSTLIMFLVGLPGFAAFFLLMRAYQAMQDARTMFRIYVLENALTIVLAFALSPVMGVGGLALAWVAPYSVASLYAVFELRRRVGNLGGWLTLRALFRIAVASAVMIAVVAALGEPFTSRQGDAVIVARLVVQIGAGTVVYLYMARLLQIREMRPVAALARRLLRR